MHPHSLVNHHLKKYLCVPLCLWQVLENYNKGKTALLSAAKIMVSPTEVDLNPESLFMDATTTSQQPTPTVHHRRNSSVRFVFRHFSECFDAKDKMFFTCKLTAPLNFTGNEGIVLLNYIVISGDLFYLIFLVNAFSDTNSCFVVFSKSPFLCVLLVLLK